MQYIVNPFCHNIGYPIDYPLYLIEGDTWAGFSFQLQLGYTTPPVYQDLTGASVVMQIRKNTNEEPLLTLSTTNGGITIGSPATNGIITINPVKISFGPSLAPYSYDIPITLSNNTTTTYFGGLVYIQPKITHA